MANEDAALPVGPVRNNALVPGKPEKNSKVPGKYKLLEFFFVCYNINFHYCFTGTLIDIYKSKHRTHFLANYYGLANAKHSGLRAPEHLNLATFLRVPNLSPLESFSSRMLTQVKILVHIANIPVHCLSLAPWSFRCLIFGAQHLTGPVDRIFFLLNIHVIF